MYRSTHPLTVQDVLAESARFRLIGRASGHRLLRVFVLRAVQLIAIQFPDPHFKRRHYKRRIFQPQMVRELAQLMAPGGALHTHILHIALRQQYIAPQGLTQ
jgi:hypothetical protein